MNFIDTDFYYTSGIEVFQFPGGEWHANVPLWPYDLVHIEAKLRTWDDVGKLLVVADTLVRQGVEVFLFAPYYPGLRQDRNTGKTTPLTAEMMAGILSQVVSHTTVVDPHSEAGLELIRSHGHVTVIEPTAFLKDLIVDRPDVVLAPDAGAEVRASAAAQLFECQLLRGSKVRDFDTGKLKGFLVPAIPDTCNRILIPDDICDGGGTFVGLLEEIRKQTNCPVDLYVTHGIFSKGEQVLEGFDRIYTTDSFYQEDESDRITTIELLPYYLGGLRP